MPFLELKVLEWEGSRFDYRDLPNLNKEDASKVLDLARIWDSRGLLALRTTPVSNEEKPSCIRVFNAWKSSLCDRQIGDRRGRNQKEGYLPGPSRQCAPAIGRTITISYRCPRSERSPILCGRHCQPTCFIPPVPLSSWQILWL